MLTRCVFRLAKHDLYVPATSRYSLGWALDGKESSKGGERTNISYDSSAHTYRIQQNTPKLFSKIYDGRGVGAEDLSQLDMISPDELNTQDIVMIALTVERVRNPRVSRSMFKMGWSTWEVGLNLQRIILLVSHSDQAEGNNRPAAVI